MSNAVHSPGKCVRVFHRFMGFYPLQAIGGTAQQKLTTFRDPRGLQLRYRAISQGILEVHQSIVRVGHGLQITLAATVPGGFRTGRHSMEDARSEESFKRLAPSGVRKLACLAQPARCALRFVLLRKPSQGDGLCRRLRWAIIQTPWGGPAVMVKTRQCPGCGAPVPEGARRCAYCGSWYETLAKHVPVQRLLHTIAPRLTPGAGEFGLRGKVVLVAGALGAAILYASGWLFENTYYWLEDEAVAIWTGALPAWLCLVALAWRTRGRAWPTGFGFGVPVFAVHLGAMALIRGRVLDDYVGIAAVFAAAALGGWLLGRALHAMVRRARVRRRSAGTAP